MKVSKRDISILLIALGLIGAFAVFQFYFRNALKEKKKYEDESATLQARLDTYYNVDENKVKGEMKGHIEEIEKDAAAYPAYYLYEDLIMFMNDWQILPYEEIYNFSEYEITESEETSNVIGVIDWNSEKLEPINANYIFSKAQLSAKYGTNSYKGFKDMINKIYLNGYPKTVKAVSAKMDAADGLVSGEIVIDFYNVQNGQNKHENVTIKDAKTGKDVKTGVPNIFGPTNTPTPSPTPTPDPRKVQKEND